MANNQNLTPWGQKFQEQKTYDSKTEPKCLLGI